MAFSHYSTLRAVLFYWHSTWCGGQGTFHSVVKGSKGLFCVVKGSRGIFSGQKIFRSQVYVRRMIIVVTISLNNEGPRLTRPIRTSEAYIPNLLTSYDRYMRRHELSQYPFAIKLVGASLSEPHT